MADSRSLGRQAAQTLSPRALVATSHPLAVQAGLEILREGGNAVDAAVAAAAVLNVVEPMSTGVGGDLFALIFDAKSGRLRGLNASGRAPKRATTEAYKKRGYHAMPPSGILSVTVPGTVHGWATLLDELGRLPLARVLEPAIGYAEHGFPVSEVIAGGWERSEEKLKQDENARRTYLTNDKAPRSGTVFKNPRLAQTLRLIATRGIEAFYQGELAQAIVAESERYEGLLSLSDLAAHTSTWVEPISTDYHGYRVYELPPNGQGLVTLEALNLISARTEKERAKKIAHNDEAEAERLHILIEALKLAFVDARAYIADPEFSSIPLERLLSKDYAAERSRLINKRANSQVKPGSVASDTVYVTVVDEERNCVSLINSLYEHFGSGVVVGETGIVLQNRGSLFSLDQGHPNCIAPNKRPYHTIIPAMVFHKGGDSPWMSFGVVGGFMQPQGQVQILTNLIDHGMGLQEAIDAPRFRWLDRASVVLEAGISADVRAGLVARGHELLPWTEAMGGFGGAQAIAVDPETNMLYGASDPRKDGCAQGF